MDADPRAQDGYGVRFDWGAAGARALIHPDALVVVVDVLSFSTTVAIAVSRGAAVRPCRHDGSATALSPIAVAAADTGAAVVTAALRNAHAVAGWAAARGYGTPDRPVNVVAAGERWPDGTLRPALEDLLGAAVLLRALDSGHRSPEAGAAAAALDGVGDLGAALRGCASGRELAAVGWVDDLAAAGEADVDAVVPLLRDGAFRDAAAAP